MKSEYVYRDGERIRVETDGGIGEERNLRAYADRKNKAEEFRDKIDCWWSSLWPIRLTAHGKALGERRTARAKRIKAVEYAYEQKVEMSTIVLGRKLGVLSDGQAYQKLITQMGKAFAGGPDEVDGVTVCVYFLEALTKIDAMKGEVDPHKSIGDASGAIVATKKEVSVPSSPEVSH